MLGQVNMPNSLGLLYEQVTEHLGFLHSSDEYKVMALASYGKPRYLSDFREIIQLTSDGKYTILPLHFEERFGQSRKRGEPLEQRHYDIAHSLQLALEETVLQLASWLYEVTHNDRLCLAGGVALNCVMNARLRDKGPFKEIWVQPAAGDAGTALGGALLIDVQERSTSLRSFTMDHAFLGPAYRDEEIEQFLHWSKLPYRHAKHLTDEVADMLVQDKIIGWFQHRLEFGPRALGARSILASPLHSSMQGRLIVPLILIKLDRIVMQH
jgi:carbamoyltransferase